MSHPLSALFIDCDSFFASVEQLLDPSLRGKPVGVAPVMAESSCCIAASYEAKTYGVKTGTRISEARIMCPGIHIVLSKPAEYIKVHHRVIEAVEDCIHVEQVLSIDEMWAWLPTNWREPNFVETLGRKVKKSVSEHVGESIKVSVGAAPNRYLAKLASKMRKPDGLFIIEHHDLPDVLHELELRDLTGIARSMETKLHAVGIHSVAALCAAPKPILHAAWGGILGDRMYYLLRGEVIPDMVSSRKSIGHSHVLPPELRAPAQAWPIACKLLHKACERLRSHELFTRTLTLHISFMRSGKWTSEIHFSETDSTLVLIRLLEKLWRERPETKALILQVAITLSNFLERNNYTPDLFAGKVAETMAEGDEKHRKLDEAIDRLRTRYGRNCVYFGTVQQDRNSAPMRISFTHIPDLRLEADSLEPEN